MSPSTALPTQLTARFMCAVAAGLLILATHTAQATPTDTVPVTVRLALDQARVPVEAVAIQVQAVDGAQPSLAVNAQTPVNPASVMKLVTAFAAFERLGSAHTWQTRIAATGTLHDGVQDGDLYLVGGADPVLAYERLWKLLRRVRALGVRTVSGDLVLDGSALTLPPHDPYAFDGRGTRPYNSGAHGLLLHYNTLQLALAPGPATNTGVTVISEQPLDRVVIDNRLITSGAPCEVWYRDLEARVEPGPRLVLSGSLPASCGPRTWSAAPLAPADYGVALVDGLWKELGGTVGGTVRTGIAAAGATTLLVDDSPPLADVVRDMNKWSSNVIARQLLASLGATRAEAGTDMVAAGAVVALEQLAAAGIDTRGLVIENGAGLSRIERIRADSLTQLLLAAWQRPWMPEFIAALPVAGQDGTARGRLANSPARGRAHIKTGTLNGVRAIAGYVLDRNGRRHAVVMMVNHPEAANTAAAMDALLEWVWAEGR